MLDPKEIMRRFPVGRVLELQESTKSKIQFMARLCETIELVPRTLQEKFGKEGAQGSQINEAIDSLLAAQPFEGMLSIALGNGWNGVDGYAHAAQAASVFRKIIWSMIYADIVTDYDIDRLTWQKLKLSLLEHPPGAGVLVLGYEFKEADFGRAGSAQGHSDTCPDFPPASFLEDDHGDD